MKKSPTRSGSPKKSAPKTVLDLAGGRQLVIRSEERMEVVARATYEERRPPEKESYTLPEAVRYLKSRGRTKYSKRTLERYVEQERIMFNRTPGKHIRFPKSALDALA